MARRKVNTEKLHVWLDPALSCWLQKQADELGIGKSEAVRRILLEEQNRRNRLFPPVKVHPSGRLTSVLVDYFDTPGRCLSPTGILAWKAVLSGLFKLPGDEYSKWGCGSTRWQYGQFRCWVHMPKKDAQPLADKLYRIVQEHSIDTPCQS